MPNYSDTATNPKLLRVFIGQIARGSQHVCRQIVMAGSCTAWRAALVPIYDELLRFGFGREPTSLL